MCYYKGSKGTVLTFRNSRLILLGRPFGRMGDYLFMFLIISNTVININSSIMYSIINTPFCWGVGTVATAPMLIYYYIICIDITQCVIYTKTVIEYCLCLQLTNIAQCNIILIDTLHNVKKRRCKHENNIGWIKNTYGEI